ncbi:MAG: GH25 family lysozyme [Lachnospiraceae bacterium]
MKKRLIAIIVALALAANTGAVTGTAYEIDLGKTQSADQSEDQSIDQSMEQSADQKKNTPTQIDTVSVKQETKDHRLQITFSPKEAENADGYEIEQQLSDDPEYYEVAEIKAGETLAYESEYFNVGERVRYRVCAYKENEFGDRIYGEYAYSTIKTVVPDQVAVTSVKSYSESSVQVNWEIADDADGYEIYQAEKKSGPFQRVKKVKEFDAEKAIVGGLEFGKTYYYKVRSYSKEEDQKVYYGLYSTVKSVRVTDTAPKSVKVTSCNPAMIRISFSKNTTADSYTIVRSTSKSGTYKTIKSNLKTNSFTDKKGLVAGKTYYYKVYAVKNGIHGAASSAVAGKAKTLQVSASTLKMIQGEKRQLLSTAIPSTTMKWKSLTPKVISMSSFGLATAKGNGKAKVQVEGHGFKKTITINVGKRVDGIDVSRWQGNIDWPKVAASGKTFAMLRVWHTAGTFEGSKDIYFEKNYTEAKKAGLKVGCYAYSTAVNTKQAKKEAANVIKILKGRKMEYPVVLDLESSNQLALTNKQRTDLVFAFKKYIESHGYKFALYANTYWLDHYIDNSRLKGVDLWVARYSPGPTTGYEYRGGGNVVMWQYTNRGSVPGISGNVDLDYGYKSY